jgi:O-antigen ligase
MGQVIDALRGERSNEWPASGWLTLAVLALFALGIAADGVVATHLGSGGAASMAVSVVLGMPIVLGAGWQVVTTGRVRPAPASLLFLTGFVAWSALTVFWSVDQDAVVKRLITNLQLLAFVWLGWQIVRSEDALRAMLGGFVAGCAVIVALTWRAFLLGNAFEDVMFEGGTRYAAEGFDPNDMALTLALGIPMATYLAVAGRRRWSYLALAYLPLAGLAIALSGSRGGTLAAAAAAACALVWLARRSKLAMALTLALVCAGIAVILRSVPWDTWSRLLTIQDELGGSLSDRDVIWRAALRLLASHPIGGVGAGGFPRAAFVALTPWRNPPLPYVHNTPLSVAVEEGAVGLLLFLGIFALIVRGVARGPLNHRALVASLVLTWCVGSAALTWEARKATWFLFLIGAVLGGLRPTTASSEPA